jgi:DNA-binding winged helix-turn-helix (wHTH) protein/tetratricopeptide (TPR) repeat protein
METSTSRARFGAFELDLTTGELRSVSPADGEPPVLLREQPFQVLQMLIERAGKLVTREDIKRKLWPDDTIVDFDNSINVSIRILRKAVGDTAEAPRYIETLARRGYRLMVPVEWLHSALMGPEQYPATPATTPFPGAHSLIGKKVSHYRVIDIIGGGGMGMVYRAEDLKLSRMVALKFLPEELTSDAVALQRFEREARTASSLNHPNICTVHAIEEHEGKPFIVMELLEGETLRTRMAAFEPNALPFIELFDIAMHACSGLEAAHEKGIIHRDIKPANIFLCKSGGVKILDFGLAKLTGDHVGFERGEAASASAPVASSADSLKKGLTRTGTTAGTAGYMSPEQVRHEELDTRTDIFSFGLVLYEMAAGQRAFAGETVVDVQEAILHQTPVPARVRNPMLPRSIDVVFSRALEKDREQRYQSVAALRNDLTRIAREANPAKRRMRQALAAVVLLALVALGSWRYGVYRQRITLSPTDTIVLGDVDNQTGDPVFDDALNIALRYEMQQTPYLNVLGIDKVNATLAQLKLPPATKVGPDAARQICGKTNSRMVISQSIADAGNGYHLEMSALDCGSGATLGREQADIGSRNEVIHELGVTAALLRAKLGEPAASLARFDQPLEKALSASLEALQARVQGGKLYEAGDVEGALKLYQRAVDLDPNFGLTQGAIGSAHGALGHYDLEAASFTRAYQLRDRMMERNRLNIELIYYSNVTGELDKAYSVLLRALELFPRDVYFHVNLANTLFQLGQLKRAADVEDEMARLGPSPLHFSWAAFGNITASRFNEARSWLAQADALKFDSLGLRTERFKLALMDGDRGTFERIFDGEVHGPNGGVFLRERSIFEAQQGRFDSSDRLDLQASKLSSNPEDISAVLVFSALRNAEAGRAIQARKIQDQALQGKLERNGRMVLALSLARSGRTGEANRLADEVSQEAPLDTIVQMYLVPTVRAAVKLQQHDPAAAIDLLRGTLPYELANIKSFDFLYPAYIRGLAYLESGDGRSAAGEFQKLIDNPGLCLWVTGSLARLQLGRAQKMMGDVAAAGKSYERFLTLWKNADPDVPIYRQAKAEYAKLKKM